MCVRCKFLANPAFCRLPYGCVLSAKMKPMGPGIRIFSVVVCIALLYVSGVMSQLFAQQVQPQQNPQRKAFYRQQKKLEDVKSYLPYRIEEQKLNLIKKQRKTSISTDGNANLGKFKGEQQPRNRNFNRQQIKDSRKFMIVYTDSPSKKASKPEVFSLNMKKTPEKRHKGMLKDVGSYRGDIRHTGHPRANPGISEGRAYKQNKKLGKADYVMVNKGPRKPQRYDGAPLQPPKKKEGKLRYDTKEGRIWQHQNTYKPSAVTNGP